MQKEGRKGFHQNYNIQIMKPYESDYLIAADIAASTRLAWRTSRLSVLISGCPIPGQDGEPGRDGNRVWGTGEGRLEL